jgi:hypothetical protein
MAIAQINEESKDKINNYLLFVNSTLMLGMPQKKVNTRKRAAGLQFDTKKISAPADPPAVRNDLRVTQWIELHIALTATARPIRYDELVGYLPNCVDAIRIQQVRLYGATGDGKVTYIEAVNGAQYSDYGTAGSRRPCVAVIPSLQTRMLWKMVLDETPWFSITGTGEAILQILVDTRTSAKFP